MHDQLYSVAHIELGEGHKRTLKATNEWIAMVEVYGFQEHFEVNLMCQKAQSVSRGAGPASQFESWLGLSGGGVGSHPISPILVVDAESYSLCDCRGFRISPILVLDAGSYSLCDCRGYRISPILVHDAESYSLCDC